MFFTTIVGGALTPTMIRYYKNKEKTTSSLQVQSDYELMDKLESCDSLEGEYNYIHPNNNIHM